MRILLTNDDGIDAPGLRTLVELFAEHEPVVVAPDRQYSACGHQATTRTPIPASRESDRRWRVSGTPVDCVRLGLSRFAPDTDVVISGINPGGNLGVDLYMSGTVAAAREAALSGRRAIALSHYCSKGRLPDWDLARARLRPILSNLLASSHEPSTFWNVNLPHPEHDDPTLEVVTCDPDPQPLQIHFEEQSDGWLYAGDYHARPRTPGHDVDVCLGGQIAASLIHIRGH
ncbi:MAG: 5'/3'-nucleotidase SurE [Planctomycetes bacterium]|nr:5'/3'-nucleotidase SurE [Planctomycetota bacterium]